MSNKNENDDARLGSLPGWLKAILGKHRLIQITDLRADKSGTKKTDKREDNWTFMTLNRSKGRSPLCPTDHTWWIESDWSPLCTFLRKKQTDQLSITIPWPLTITMSYGDGASYLLRIWCRATSGWLISTVKVQQMRLSRHSLIIVVVWSMEVFFSLKLQFSPSEKKTWGRQTDRHTDRQNNTDRRIDTASSRVA